MSLTSGAGPERVRRQWRLYRTAHGGEVAREELHKLPVAAEMTALMKRFAKNEHFERECEHLGRGLYALRLSMAHNEYRAIFCREGRYGQVLLALTFVIKKSRKLPKGDLKRAYDRMQDWHQRGEEG